VPHDPEERVLTTEPTRRDAGPVFRAFLGYQRWADKFSEVTGTIAAWVVVPTVVIGFINVILRYTGAIVGRRLTSNAVIEFQLYLYASIFLLGFAYVLKHHINVRVDFWFANQPTGRKAWIDFVGNWIALIPFCALGIWVSFPQAWQSIRVGEQSPDADGLPRGPIKGLLALAFLFLLIQAVAEQVKLYAVITGRGDLVRIDQIEEPIRIE
jgi:TRAP-type mannitol/chloroaromatic compound transport system permease small subunit